MKYLLILVLVLTHCKTARNTTDDPTTRPIVLKTTGLPEGTKFPKASELQLKICAEASTSTVPDGAGVIKMQAEKVKKNEKCSARVSSLSPDPDDEFIGESGVYFVAKNFSLREDSVATLVGLAAFQATSKKKITSTASVCSLDIPVLFPEDLPAVPITATLACTPAISNLGTFTAASGKKGVLNFKIPVTAEGQKRSCTLLDIGADSGAKWFQSPLSPALEISVKENCQNTVAEQALLSYKKPDADDVDVDIEHVFSK